MELPRISQNQPESSITGQNHPEPQKEPLTKELSIIHHILAIKVSKLLTKMSLGRKI